MAAANTFDAIVVGSGMSGGWAAKELCEKGLKTLVLERGRNMRHVVDYTTALKDPWQLPHNNRATNADRAAQPIQSTLYLYDQSTKQHLRRRHEVLATCRRSRSTGTAAIRSAAARCMWARHVFRYSDLDFEANQSEGVGIDWPIRYADIAPWYEHVEKFIGASGENSGLPQLPDADPAAAVRDERAREAHQARSWREAFTAIASSSAARPRCCRASTMAAGPARAAINARAAVPYSAYFSSNGVTLPAAAATGNLTLQPDAIVHSLIYDEAQESRDRRARGRRATRSRPPSISRAWCSCARRR